MGLEEIRALIRILRFLLNESAKTKPEQARKYLEQLAAIESSIYRKLMAH